MNGIWKTCAIFLALVFVLSTVVIASEYVDITEQCEVKILKIVDGESMIVEIIGTKEMAMIKMIGVDASGSDTAKRFNDTELLGKTVVISNDPFVPTPEGRWSMVYVYTDYELFNRKTIAQGHAKINTRHVNALLYPTLSGEAANAESENIGIWNDGQGLKNFSYASSRININTASISQLATKLDGVDYFLAEQITRFRQLNPFRKVGDIKFVSGFTKELFDKNRNKMTVSTNISDALKEELETLIVLSEHDINLILDYRAKKHIENPSDLIAIIGDAAKYENIKKFVDTRQVTELFLQENVVNINTASAQKMIEAGLNYSYAVLLADTHRSNTPGVTSRGYTMKTLGELMYFPGIYMSFDQINSMEGRLRTMTDINTAPYNELLSLNESITLVIAADIVEKRPYSDISDISKYLTEDIYTKISKHIYTKSDSVSARVNINTATKDQLIAAGFSDEQSASLVNLGKRMRYIWDIPFDLGELDHNTALYTNVNKALYNELISLNNGMTSDIAVSIISYRDNQPIGSMDELRQIFYDHDASIAFDFLQSFMVLR